MAKVYIPSEIRNLVSQRAKNLCEYCQSQADYSTESRFAVEHIIPVSAGGNSGVDNLALSCSGCNGYKYDKTEARDPATYQLTPLFHPRVQNWAEHFS